jgi:hypothetical protein
MYGFELFELMVLAILFAFVLIFDFSCKISTNVSESLLPHPNQQTDLTVPMQIK